MAIKKRPQVTVVGAGFSGLTTAYYLLKSGANVRVLERGDRAGGLISTRRTDFGLVETAANGILNSSRLEALCDDLGVRLIAPKVESRGRYIWRSSPRRFPLTAGETFRLAAGLVFNIARLGPAHGESISDWGNRVLGDGATRYGLITALGGIYAGDGDRMSASLILRRRANRKARSPKPSKPKIRGTVAPAGGMQELIDALTSHLRKLGAEIHFNRDVRLKPGEPVAICTSAAQAAELLKGISPEASGLLGRVEMLSLVTATCFYRPDPDLLRGFGCLFPREEGFRARGVLFNDSIFEGRSDFRSETWILGGALDPAIAGLSDEELHRIIAADRQRFTGRLEEPLGVNITRWPSALPHYDLELESILDRMPELPAGTVLAGNYLGGIGLAKLLDRSVEAAGELIERI